MEIHQSPPSSFSPPGRPRGFKLRLPLLRSLSNSKASLDDAEVGHIPTATPLPLHPDHHSHESLGPTEFLPLPPLPPDHQQQLSGSRWAIRCKGTNRPKTMRPRIIPFLHHHHGLHPSYSMFVPMLPQKCILAIPSKSFFRFPRSALQGWPEDSQEDQRTLLSSDPPVSPPPPPPPPSHRAQLVGPLTQSSPCVAPHHRLSLNPDGSGSNCTLTHSRSRESFHSMRRASSVDEIEAMRPDWDRKNRRASIRPGSSSTGEAFWGEDRLLFF